MDNINEYERPPANRKTPVYIGRRRKDGKYPVTFCFWSKKIRKIMTQEQVDETRLDPSYSVQG